jgi:hypothetical protein
MQGGGACSLFTVHPSLLLLRIAGRERHPAGALSIEADLEGVLAGPGQRDVEHEHRPGFHIYDSRWGLSELDGAFTAQKLRTGVVHKLYANGVCADFRTAASYPKHQVGARVDSRKVREPDMLKHAEHAEFALLVDQGVVGDDSEIEVQGSADSDGRDDVVLLDLVHHIHAFSDLAENGVHLVEMWLRCVGHEELAAAGVLTGVSHAQGACGVFVGVEVRLTLDLIAWPAGPYAWIARFARERIASLDHEVLDDAVEPGAVVELTIRQLLEIADGAGHFGVE